MTTTAATVTPRELADRRGRGEPVDLIDVRTAAEYAAGHARGAEGVPLDRLDPTDVRPAAGGPVYLICQSGPRSAEAQRRLAAGGVRAVVVAGGTDAWLAGGCPAVHGRGGMAMERQVRIVAGSLVLLGLLLGWRVDPRLYGLAALVAAGLVFAGISDTCAMARVLAKLPWNRRGVGRP